MKGSDLIKKDSGGEVVDYQRQKETQLALAEQGYNVELDKKGNVVLDDNGRMKFKDVIRWSVTHAELMFLWTNCKMILEEGLVPPDDREMVFDLMMKLAEQEKVTTRPYDIELPINFFTGLWHVNNSCRKFDLYYKEKDTSKRLDEVTMKLAKLLDSYHAEKGKEGFMKRAGEDASISNKLLGKDKPAKIDTDKIVLKEENVEIIGKIAAHDAKKEEK